MLIALPTNQITASPLGASLKEKNKAQVTYVSPNPAKSAATVHFSKIDNQSHYLEVYDMIGNKVQSYKVAEGSKFDISVDDLEAGIYFYFVLNEKERIANGRLIVRH